LVAMFNFMQGKELAGQERAFGSAAFASGGIDAERQQQWLHSIESQERCFQVFSDFSDAPLVALWRGCQPSAAAAERERLRRADELEPSIFFDDTSVDEVPVPYGRQLERSILDMVQEQSRRLQSMSDELATARAALNERKLVERAKGLLMAHRHLSEEEAHK